MNMKVVTAADLKPGDLCGFRHHGTSQLALIVAVDVRDKTLHIAQGTLVTMLINSQITHINFGPTFSFSCIARA